MSDCIFIPILVLIGIFIIIYFRDRIDFHINIYQNIKDHEAIQTKQRIIKTPNLKHNCLQIFQHLLKT